MPIVRVTGLAELRKALQLVAKEAPKELALTNQRAGNIVAVEAKRRAPKGPHEGGGRVMPIATSISAARSANKVTVTAGGPKTPHAAPYEFGGSIPRAGHKGMGRRGKQFARALGGRSLTHIHKRAYLLPAAEAKIDQVVEAYYHMIDSLVARFERS